MKMLKHRNRERDGWMPPAGSPAPQAALPATTAAGPAGVTPEASAPAAPAAPAAPHSPPVSILTNASSVSQPASANSAAALDRPRKKLSFRDPEVTGTANSKEVAGLILAPGHLASLRDFICSIGFGWDGRVCLRLACLCVWLPCFCFSCS